MSDLKRTPTEYVLSILQSISSTKLIDLNHTQNALKDWLTNLTKIQPHIIWDLRLIPLPDKKNDTTMDIILFDGTTIKTVTLDSTQLHTIPMVLVQSLLQLNYRNNLIDTSNPSIKRIERIIQNGAFRTGGNINADLIALAIESIK